MCLNIPHKRSVLQQLEDRLRVERSSGKGAADQNSVKPVLPGGSGGHAVEISVSAYDNGGVGELYRGAGLTNGGGNGMIKSNEYDFINGVLGSSMIPKEQSEKLDEIISVIQRKHLDVIGKMVKEVVIEPNRGYCS